MALGTEERKNIVFFTGHEVEHTACYGMLTLFVVGTPPLDDILSLAKKENIKHIYFGTSQSFNPKYLDDWQTWDNRITGCLKHDFWVTLDFDAEYAKHEWFHDNGWCEYNKFVPMISVKLPFVKLFNYNATIKIDDNTWGFSNPGVWTHQLHDLMDRDKFTHWDQYVGDNILDKETVDFL